MQENPYHQDREEMKELLKQYQDLKSGKRHSFLEEEAFERIIDYFDDTEDLVQAIEAVELGVEQYPYSSALREKRGALIIPPRRYHEALTILEQVELLDSSDINLYILKTDAYLALDQPQKAATLLESALAHFE